MRYGEIPKTKFKSIVSTRNLKRLLRNKKGDKAVTGLERVFSLGNQWYDRIFYDSREGKYYDRYTDLYLSQEELKAYGL